MSKRPCHLKIKPDDPYYPMSYKGGYISPARYAMAKHLDRCLGSDEMIFYLDGNPMNTDISNLKLVGHKELNLLNDERRISSAMDRMGAKLALVVSQLANEQFMPTPCSCPKCSRSREARQAGYRLEDSK